MQKPGAVPEVTPQDVLDVVTLWCRGGFELSPRDLHIWQSIQDLTILFLGGDNYMHRNVPLPCGLRTLTFGPELNFKIDHIPIPDSVVMIQFGTYFDQSLAGVSLPCGLQQLRFGRCFNKPLDDLALPATLQILMLGNGSQQNLKNVIPPKGLQIVKH